MHWTGGCSAVIRLSPTRRAGRDERHGSDGGSDQPYARETSNNAREGFAKRNAMPRAKTESPMSQRESDYQRKPLDQYETPAWVTGDLG
jgi:hypothetical protein